MADDHDPEQIHPLEPHEFLELFLLARGLRARADAPAIDQLEFELHLNPDTQRLTDHLCAIAAAHETNCAKATYLPEVLATLATHVVITDLITDDPDLRALYVAVLSDTLVHRNRHFIQWDDPDSYPPTLEDAGATGCRDHLQTWYADNLGRHTGRQLSAFILGAMTDATEEELAAVRRRASALRRVLERHGYRVHAPCCSEPNDRDDLVVIEDDIEHIAKADIVIALLDPPAIGVGVMLGEAARSHPPVIFVAEATRDITPMSRIIGDPNPVRIIYITDAQMIADVEQALVNRRQEIEDRSQRRANEPTDSLESFAEFSQAYHYAIDNNLEVTVTDHPDYRVRLICTHRESFQAATQTELQDICRALNDLLYGPETGEPIPDADHRDDTHRDEAYVPPEWDQPSLFDSFTRHTEAANGELQDGWEKLNPLTNAEINFAHTTAEFLNLSENDLERMIHEARLVRYREKLAGVGASRANFGDGDAWKQFWYANLGRS